MMLNTLKFKEYRYGFNGYEKDDEVSGSGNHLGFNDYGYDPRTVHRWNIDPKTKSYPWQSPYVYAANSPIQKIDKDGENDTYYLLVIDSKTGKSAFKTLVFEDNYPDKQHFIIHYRDKEGNVKNIKVDEKTFNKARFAAIKKTTHKLLGTKTFTRKSFIDKTDKTVEEKSPVNVDGNATDSPDETYGLLDGSQAPEIGKNKADVNVLSNIFGEGKPLNEFKPGDSVLLDETFGTNSVAPTDITTVNVVDSNASGGFKRVRTATIKDFFNFPKTSGEKK